MGRCNPDSANGVDKTVYYLSNAQAESGNDVAVFSITSKPLIPIPKVIVKQYPPTRFPFNLPKTLLNDIIERRPDIIHMHSVYTPLNVILGYRLRQIKLPYVVTPHGGLSINVLKKRWWIKIPYKFIFERNFLNNANFIHAVEDPNDIREYGVKIPIVTVPNGLNFSIIPDNCDKKLIVKQHPSASGKRVFLFIGRLDIKTKGLDLLLEGFSRANLQNALLVIVGPDKKNSRCTLENLAQKLRIDSKVVFTGPLFGRTKFDFLAGADVFVHTSRWEGLSFSVLEAFACARPCMLTPPADPLDFTRKYEAGIIVNPNKDSIAEGFQNFMRLGDNELNNMGKNGKLMVENEFSWSKIARDLTDAYKSYLKA